jgi:uncharacterized protein (TIGR02246 family)
VNKDLEVRRLIDVNDIEKLKYIYCLHCDNNYDPNGIAACFTEDGTFGNPHEKPLEGREAIRNFFKSTPEKYPFAIHHVCNPIIEVDGDQATGIWKLFQPCTMNGSDGARAMWIAGNYFDTYARRDGKWLFHKVLVDLKYVTPFEDGWTKTPFAFGTPTR